MCMRVLHFRKVFPLPQSLLWCPYSMCVVLQPTQAGSYYSPQVQRGLKKAAVSERSGLTASGLTAPAARPRPASAQGTRDSLSSIETCV